MTNQKHKLTLTTSTLLVSGRGVYKMCRFRAVTFNVVANFVNDLHEFNNNRKRESNTYRPTSMYRVGVKQKGAGGAPCIRT